MVLFKVKKLIKIIEKDGWQKVAAKGSHVQYKHPYKKGKVTIPQARIGNTIPLGTERKILKQAGINELLLNRKKD